MSTRTGEAEADGWQGGIYGGWQGGGAFVQAYAGIGSLDLEIERTAVIDQIEGETDGNTVTAGGQAGYLLGMGGLRIGPVLGVRYARAKLDGYTETGDPVLTLNVGDQEVDSLTGSAGVELRGDLSSGGLSVQPYLAAAVEREFQGDARTILYSLTAAPEIVNRWQLPRRSHDTYGRLSGGINLSLGGAIAVQVAGTATLEAEQGNDLAGSVALRVGF
jgi:outer membrane autotransporter protein